jgi:very-short-patch-repair endonuclease
MENKELFIALLPRKSSLAILKSEGWYHIPVENAPERWPPKMLAFYQGKVFGKDEAYKIRYFGEVAEIDIVPRKELFPGDEKNAAKAENLYYRLRLKSLQERPVPISSPRPRRLVFIPTTLRKFELAEQVNDLFDASGLEDRLWATLKQAGILAERQWKIIVQSHNYYLDFAVFCKNGKLAIETDGYTVHYDSRNQIDYDTWRRNEIELDGWRFLHYTSKHIQEDSPSYLQQIEQKIAQLGGPQAPQDFERQAAEGSAKYIVDGEEPL